MRDAGPAQPDQVDARRAVPVENIASSRELGSAPSAECTAPTVTEAACLQHLRSACVHLLISDRAAYSGCSHYRRAGDRRALASRLAAFQIGLRDVVIACREHSNS